MSGRRRTVLGKIKVASALGHQFIMQTDEMIASSVSVLPKKTSRKRRLRSFELSRSFKVNTKRSILVYTEKSPPFADNNGPPR